MNVLDEIAKSKGTDKSSEIHNYCVKYEKYLPFKRHDPLKMLEIGVLKGESLRMWKEYFYRSQIFGIDIMPECKQYEEERINIEIGSQVDDVFLKIVSQKYGPFDIILDDGSHINEHIIYSFEHLFESVKSGGIYIVEDCGTSYWSEWGGGLYKKGTSIEYFKNRIDEVNFIGEHVIQNASFTNNIFARKEDALLEQFKMKGYNHIGIQFESINFLNGIIIITKR